MKYTCDVCKGTFKSGWTDEEALAEFKDVFAEYPNVNRSVLCDRCYKSMMEYTRTRAR